jgi:hypothetical protein
MRRVFFRPRGQRCLSFCRVHGAESRNATLSFPSQTNGRLMSTCRALSGMRERSVMKANWFSRISTSRSRGKKS